MHLGHISNPRALDRLEAVAPVLAVSTDLDDQLFVDAIAADVARGRIAHRTSVIGVGGLRVGMVHDLANGEPAIGPAEGSGLTFLEGPLQAVPPAH